MEESVKMLADLKSNFTIFAVALGTSIWLILLIIGIEINKIKKQIKKQ